MSTRKKLKEGENIMKIVNAKKFIRSIILILGFIFIISLIIAKSSLSYKVTDYKVLFVSSGETLWNIATLESKSNSYYKEKDIRYIVNDIMKENKLNSSTLQVNQKLLIPM